MNEKFEELISGYLDHKVGVSDHFLPEGLALRLQANLLRLDQQGRMKSAGIGNHAVRDASQTKRGDKTSWIDEESTDPAEREFLGNVNRFIAYLNESCYAGINGFEFHYALYETGTAYQRHIDQFRDNAERKFSLVHYLNSDWQNTDGGALTIYPPGKTATIFPHLQKAVFFKSDECEHEVERASRPRMSITGWLKRC